MQMKGPNYLTLQNTTLHSTQARKRPEPTHSSQAQTTSTAQSATAHAERPPKRLGRPPKYLSNGIGKGDKPITTFYSLQNSQTVTNPQTSTPTVPQVTVSSEDEEEEEEEEEEEDTNALPLPRTRSQSRFLVEEKLQASAQLQNQQDSYQPLPSQRHAGTIQASQDDKEDNENLPPALSTRSTRTLGAQGRAKSRTHQQEPGHQFA